MAPNTTPNLSRRQSLPKGEDTVPSSDITPPNSPPNSPAMRRSCFQLLEISYPESPLMRECTHFQDVQVELQRRNSEMSVRSSTTPPSMLALPSFRNEVEPSHAEIQRRMMSDLTTTTW